MYLDFFFFFLFCIWRKSQTQRTIPTESKNSKQHKPAIVCAGNNGSFHGVSSLKNALWDSELTCKVIFVISQSLWGHPHPWLHHNTHNELQLQPDTIGNKEINSKLVHGKVNTVSDLQVVSEYLSEIFFFFFTEAPQHKLFFSWSLHQCFAPLEFSF